jgi:hypothetical protein
MLSMPGALLFLVDCIAVYVLCLINWWITFQFLFRLYFICICIIEGSISFNFCRVNKILKVGFPPVLSIYFIRYDLIICAFTQICILFKITLWWTNLFLSIPLMLFLNIFFDFIYAVVFFNSFLVLRILWSIFRCRLSSSFWILLICHSIFYATSFPL